ncbi:hypothetical protein SUGI_0253900 [Cryptomeria japonica]|nr:hypothetical protein SUGI_0253900 [Cryptomeria japonica]
MKIHLKIWVHLFCLLLVGLKVLNAERLLPENKELYATKDEAYNLVEFRFRENRSGGDAEEESHGLKVQRLSTSKPSPGVGHMQVSKVPKSLKRGAKSSIQMERVLESTPSPGDGN